MNSLLAKLRNDTDKNYYIKYTAVFVFIFSISFVWFFLENKSFIWVNRDVIENDGIEQHFVSLVYYGEYLRQVFSDLFSTGKLVLPLYDFSIGYGSDIPTTLHYYAFGDPLNLLAVFFSPKHTEFLFCFLAVLRVYLAGVAFSFYCKVFKKPRFDTLCGACIYAFCGFALWVVVRHPYFINPMIYLPLLLIGVEKIFAGKRPYLFIIMVFISTVSNFYFFYMLTIFVVLYTVIRFFAVEKTNRIQKLFYWLGRFSLYYALGLLMACILFYPVVMLVLSGGRTGVNNAVDLLYNFSYYEKFVSGFITQRIPGYWSVMGYSVIALAAVVLLFTKKKEHFELKLGFILLTGFLLLPKAGHILHGFSYVSNRWIWAYSFVIALIAVTKMPDIFNPERKQIKVLSMFAVLYFLHGVFLSDARSEEFFITNTGLLILIVLMFNQMNKNEPESKPKEKSKSVAPAYAGKIMIVSLISLGVAVQAYYRFAPTQGDYVSQFKEPGEAIISQTENPSMFIRDLGDETFFRYESNQFGGQYVKNNSSLLNRQNGTDFYFSLNNPNISKLLQDELYSYAHFEYNYKGLESRAMLGALSSVKYFVVKPNLKRFLPYGYEDAVFENDNYCIVQNNYFLPLGYTYDNVIPEKDYQKMSAIEKQQAILQGAVIGGDSVKKMNNIKPQFNHSVIPYEIECGEGISYKKGTFEVENTKSTVKLTFDGLKECETYLLMNNLNFLQTKPTENHEKFKDKIEFSWENRLWKAADSSTLTFKSGDISRSILHRTPYHQFYTGKHDYMIQLFYSKDAKKQIEIS
ncbi:MAG: YfhO family protein, partial [Oscillospiraceae bacterium]|nr:YfhO family protein [Oscillospiraceae bacterium]